MAEFHFRIRYKESKNVLKKVRHKKFDHGMYGNGWRKMKTPPTTVSDNDPDLIKIWPKEHSCRYVWHNGNWYTNC